MKQPSHQYIPSWNLQVIIGALFNLKYKVVLFRNNEIVLFSYSLFFYSIQFTFFPFPISRREGMGRGRGTSFKRKGWTKSIIIRILISDDNSNQFIFLLISYPLPYHWSNRIIDITKGSRLDCESLGLMLQTLPLTKQLQIDASVLVSNSIYYNRCFK